MKRSLAAFVFAVLAALVSSAALAGEVKVMISGGLSSAYEALGAEFTRETGNTLSTARGPSMGETPQAIPNRIERGEPVDVVIMVGYALDELIKRGKVVPSSRVDIANSSIAMAVKSGAPKPDIGTLEAFKRTLLEAKSIAYSDSASGVYIQKTLLPRLGVWEQVKDKSRMIPAEPVGQVVARGDAQIGFQQMSELKAVPGIDIVGLIPEGAQLVTVFSAGIASHARNPEGAKALIDLLTSPRGKAAISATGLDPIAR